MGHERRLTLVSDREGKPEVYLLSTSHPRRLSFSSNSGVGLEPVSSPSGKVIAFTSTRSGHREDYILAETNSKRLTNSPDSGESWSRLGNWSERVGANLTFNILEITVFTVDETGCL